MLQKLLEFNPKTMTLRTESIAGITTFLTMSYILAVNTSILSSTGMDKGAVFTATALATALSTLLLAFMAKLPLAQAPSMGINAFFAFTLVQGMGYPWQVAMAALFVEGLLFILITFFNVREIVLNSIPATLRYAISVGIGMFIAFIGLKNAGIIVSDPATFVTFGPFTPVSVLALTGILLSGLLVVKQVKGALFYSILICTLIGIPLGVTTIPEGFLPISTPHSLAPTFCQFDFSQLFTLDMAVIIFTLLFMDMFDTIGTLVALTYRIGIVKENGEIPCAKETMLADAHRFHLWSHTGLFYDYHLLGECFGRCRRRAFRVYLAGHRWNVPLVHLLRSHLPAHPRCCHDRSIGTGGCLYDGVHHSNRHEEYCGGTSCVHHHHNYGADLLRCQWHHLGYALLCVAQTGHGQTPGG